jgi:RimJ/RimL family protein N-acetyltransferase
MAVSPDARVEGQLVALRRAVAADIPDFVRWYSDPDVRHWLHLSEVPIPTIESETQRFEAHDRDPFRVNWVIETLDGRPIGNAGLAGIDDLHARAELYISIGDKQYWSQGYGADAVRLVLRFAFAELALNRVELITDSDNERAISCYENCGFIREGTLRSKRLRYGEPLDMEMMSVLREDWAAQQAGG